MEDDETAVFLVVEQQGGHMACFREETHKEEEE